MRFVNQFNADIFSIKERITNETPSISYYNLLFQQFCDIYFTVDFITINHMVQIEKKIDAL